MSKRIEPGCFSMMHQELIAKIPQPMPKCSECDGVAFRKGLSSTTAAYYPPIYVNGINTNPDRNKTTTEWECMACNHVFTEES